MDEKKVMEKIEKMSMEEKLKLLSETDKAYIRGFIDRAVSDLQSVDLRSVGQSAKKIKAKGPQPPKTTNISRSKTSKKGETENFTGS